MRLATAALAMSVWGASLIAQESSAPAFEVASIKPNKSGDPGTRFGLPGGGNFTATNATARELVRIAFQLQEHQLIGLPDWTRNERFDIIARAAQDIALTGDPGKPTPVFLMLQSLLRERFQLTARPDTREMPIYALVMARADGQLGAKLTRSTTDCAAVFQAQRERAKSGAPPPAPSDRVLCGSRGRQGSLVGGAVELDGGEASLAMILSRLMGRPVVNRTGLTGAFDFTLEFTQPAGGSSTGADSVPADSPLPSLTIAVQEQLGLKLESGRGPVEALVIDRFERPTPCVRTRTHSIERAAVT